jgi:hypothetical protein
MTRRELRLALALALALAASAAAVGLSFGLERMTEAQSEIRDYRHRIDRLSSVSVDEEGARARLRRIIGLVERAEDRVASASKLSVSAFGRELMDLLAAQRIAPEKYLVLSDGAGDRIEVTVKCDAGDFLRFLKSATEAKGWSVPYVSLRSDSGPGRVDAVMRLGR